MNKICPESLQFWRPGTEYELEAEERDYVWTILQALLRAFDIQETWASLNISFLIKWRRQTWIWKIQLSPANLSFIDCLLIEGDQVVAKGTTVAWDCEADLWLIDASAQGSKWIFEEHQDVSSHRVQCSCWLSACTQFTLSKADPASFRKGSSEKPCHLFDSSFIYSEGCDCRPSTFSCCKK